MKQIVCIVREEWLDLLKMSEKTIKEVMTAGEQQRLAANRDPNGWVNEKPLPRIKHAIDHLLTVWHHQNPSLLTHDTCLEQVKHAWMGLTMALVNMAREDKTSSEAIEE